METKVEDAGPCRKLLHVSVPGEDIREDYDGLLTAVSRQVSVPGFRKGKAPPAVVERRFGREIEEEAKQQLVPRFYRQALTREGLTPVAIVGVEDVALDKLSGLSFRVMVDVAPSFKLPRYRKISLNRQAGTVTDKDVDEAVGRLRQRLGRFVDVSDRPLREGDLALIDYRGAIDGRPLGELSPDCTGLGEGSDFWALLGEPEFIPGLPRAMVGLAIGDEKDVEVVFPEPFHVEAVAGRRATYHVAVKGARAHEPAELDAETLKQLDADSEAALRERVRGDLQTAAEQRERARLKEEIAKHLLEKTRLDLPASIVEQETRLTVRDIIRRNAMQGVAREQIEQHQNEILEAATRTSVDRVKLSYILSRIADEENIAVSDEEIDQRIERLAQRSGQSAGRVRAELEEHNGMEGLRSEVRADKTADFLLSQAKIKG